MDLKKSFTYDLKIPVDVSVKGKFVSAQSIEVFAPNNSVFSDVNIIDVEYNRSQAEASKSVSLTFKELTPEQIKAFDKLSRTKSKETFNPESLVNDMIKNGADVEKCVGALKSILTKQINGKAMCNIDVEPMLDLHFESLSFVDTKNILGLYIRNFLDASRNT